MSNERFISVDPGINFCSVVVCDVGEEFRVLESNLVNNNRAFRGEEKDLEKIHGGRAVKIFNIIDKIEECIEKYKITKLVVEAPFYSALTPSAYGSLLEIIFAIKYLVVAKREMEMVLVEPTVIKRFFSGKGNASKAIMKQFLINRFSSGDVKMDYKIEDLSEHEIDGIAVGFTHWQLQLKVKEE